MQPMWLCLFSGKQFEETFDNTRWRKVKLNWHMENPLNTATSYLKDIWYEIKNVISDHVTRQVTTLKYFCVCEREWKTKEIVLLNTVRLSAIWTTTFRNWDTYILNFNQFILPFGQIHQHFCHYANKHALWHLLED